MGTLHNWTIINYYNKINYFLLFQQLKKWNILFIDVALFTLHFAKRKKHRIDIMKFRFWKQTHTVYK